MIMQDVNDLMNCKEKYIRELNKRISILENRKKWSSKEAKKKVEKEADFYNAQLEKIEDLLRKLTKFKTKDFIEFMRNFLCLTQGNYIIGTYVVEGELTQRRTLSDMIKGKQKKHNKIYYLICDETTEEFIQENINDEESFEDFINSPASYDTTIFEDEEIIFPFNEDLSLKYKYCRYPKLKSAIYELIQLKLENPTISDKKRYEQVLENAFYSNQKKYEQELNKKSSN